MPWVRIRTSLPKKTGGGGGHTHVHGQGDRGWGHEGKNPEMIRERETGRGGAGQGCCSLTFMSLSWGWTGELQWLEGLLKEVTVGITELTSLSRGIRRALWSSESMTAESPGTISGSSPIWPARMPQTPSDFSNILLWSSIFLSLFYPHLLSSDSLEYWRIIIYLVRAVYLIQSSW